MRPLLKEWREFRDLSQAAVAEKLATSDVAISRWETGRREPGLDDLAALASLYQCRPQDLWDPPDQPHGPPLDPGLLQRCITMVARKMAGMKLPFKPEQFSEAVLQGYMAAATGDQSRAVQRTMIERSIKQVIGG